MGTIYLSLVIPCRNEEANLPFLLSEACFVLKNRFHDNFEIILVDNCSRDASVEIAHRFDKVRVVREDKIGYGAAIKKGLKEAKANHIGILDADATYDCNDIVGAYDYLKKNELDFVYGDRLNGKVEKGAMPFIHEKFGTPLLNYIFNFLYGCNVRDVNSGLRVFRRDIFINFRFLTSGMSFASEMFALSCKKKLRTGSLPISYKKSPKPRKSHLKTYRDGFAHLLIIIYLRFSNE